MTKSWEMAMIEITLMIFMCFAVARVAEASGQSGMAWGWTTFILSVAAIFLIPIPYLRFLISGAVALILMFLAKGRGGRYY